MRVPFTKMEGCGNDYLLVDAIADPFPLEHGPAVARALSHRHFGVGADGLIALLRGDGSLRMVMWNADGSRGAMCGNGLRCLARLAVARGHVEGPRFVVDTDAGPRRVEVLPGGDVRADMGQVLVSPRRRTTVAGEQIELVPGDAGNPHAVVFVADVAAAPVQRLGAALQDHGDFPGGVNVEFVQLLGPEALRQRTFERGSGETLACGTGAAVAVAAAQAAGHVTGERAAVELRGGTLWVRGRAPSLAIEGPARTVCTGVAEVGDL